MFLVEITTFLCRQSPRFRHYFFGQITKQFPVFFSDWIMLNHLRSSLHINMNYNFYKNSDISPCLSLHVCLNPHVFSVSHHPSLWPHGPGRSTGIGGGGGTAGRHLVDDVDDGKPTLPPLKYRWATAKISW